MDSEPTPPTVSAREVLSALSEIRRRGHWPLLQELESVEPELAEFLLEEISAIHHTLLRSGAKPKIVRRLQRQVQALTLVCVLVFRPRRDDDTTPDPPPAGPKAS